MPDVLEMPYYPGILGAGIPDELSYNYRLGAHTCLAGDIIGDYSFPQPLKSGDRLVFTDMAHYTMVKNNTFNGIGLPSIALYSEKEGMRIIKSFGYEDFKGWLS
jgi:carboxynorspermidine decarboxylase